MSSDVAPAVAAPRTLNTVAGPRGWPVLGVAPQVRSDTFHQQLEEWARRYGSVYAFRIAKRRFLAVSDPDVVASVLRRRPGVFRRTTRLEQVARELGFLGLFAASGDTWRRQRPMVLAGLDPAHIRNYLPALEAITDRLRRRWSISRPSAAASDQRLRRRSVMASSAGR